MIYIILCAFVGAKNQIIHRIRVSGGGTHYFNKIDGKFIDLTVEQFELYNIPVSYEPNEEMDCKYC